MSIDTSVTTYSLTTPIDHEWPTSWRTEQNGRPSLNAVRTYDVCMLCRYRYRFSFGRFRFFTGVFGFSQSDEPVTPSTNVLGHSFTGKRSQQRWHTHTYRKDTQVFETAWNKKAENPSVSLYKLNFHIVPHVLKWMCVLRRLSVTFSASLTNRHPRIYYYSASINQGTQSAL